MNVCLNMANFSAFILSTLFRWIEAHSISVQSVDFDVWLCVCTTIKITNIENFVLSWFRSTTKMVFIDFSCLHCFDMWCCSGIFVLDSLVHCIFYCVQPFLALFQRLTWSVCAVHNYYKPKIYAESFDFKFRQTLHRSSPNKNHSS